MKNEIKKCEGQTIGEVDAYIKDHTTQALLQMYNALTITEAMNITSVFSRYMLLSIQDELKHRAKGEVR